VVEARGSLNRRRARGAAWATGPRRCDADCPRGGLPV